MWSQRYINTSDFSWNASTAIYVFWNDLSCSCRMEGKRIMEKILPLTGTLSGMDGIYPQPKGYTWQMSLAVLPWCQLHSILGTIAGVFQFSRPPRSAVEKSRDLEPSVYLHYPHALQMTYLSFAQIKSMLRKVNGNLCLLPDPIWMTLTFAVDAAIYEKINPGYLHRAWIQYEWCPQVINTLMRTYTNCHLKIPNVVESILSNSSAPGSMSGYWIRFSSIKWDFAFYDTTEMDQNCYRALVPGDDTILT